MQYKFRDLTKNEIECRVAQISENKGVSLLLYKDARVDQNILDETVGAENWDRDHKELKGNIYCGIGIWNEKQNRLVWKWDAGKESYSDSEKGEASDSFKRAGFNWGIGRELYTAPFIFVSKDKCNIKSDSGKAKCSDNFEVAEIEITNKEITKLVIRNNTTGYDCFKWGKGKIELKPNELIPDAQARAIYKSLLNRLGDNDNVIDYLQEKFDIDNTSKLTSAQYVQITQEFKK